MFEVGDIIRLSYDGETYFSYELTKIEQSFQVISQEIKNNIFSLNGEQIIIIRGLKSGMIFKTNSTGWEIDKNIVRRQKIKKLCSKLETK